MGAAYNNGHLTAPLKGSCLCGSIKYKLLALPMRVNCCHCRDCQIKTGSAFVVNIIIERSNVQLTSATQPFNTDESGGTFTARCPTCYVSLWNTYPSDGDKLLYVRAGTLENTKDIYPDVHYFTRTKADWVTIPEGVKSYVADAPEGEPGYWSDESRIRLDKVLNGPA